MSKEKKTGNPLMKALDALMKRHKIENAVMTLELTTSDGGKLVFTELETTDTPSTGDTATVDGKPAEGDVITTDGDGKKITYVFEAGELKEVKEEEVEDEQTPEQMKAENEKLKADLATAQKATTDALASYEALAKDVATFRAQFVNGDDDDTPDDVPERKGHQMQKREPKEKGVESSVMANLEKKKAERFGGRAQK